MRCLFIVALAGCAVVSSPAEPPHASITDAQALPAPIVVAGERIAWDVWWQGAQIGSATVETTEDGSHTLFTSGGLASLVGRLRFEQATRARTTTEDVVSGNTSEHRIVALDTVRVPGGTELHTLASTLGAVRAWAKIGAPHAFAWVVVDGELYRVDVATPVSDGLSEILSESGQTASGKRDVVARSSTPEGAQYSTPARSSTPVGQSEPAGSTPAREAGHGALRSSTPERESHDGALRVDGSVRPLDPDGATVDFSVWLANDATRTPVRFAAVARGERITAQFRDSSAITRR